MPGGKELRGWFFAVLPRVGDRFMLHQGPTDGPSAAVDHRVARVTWHADLTSRSKSPDHVIIELDDD